MLTIFRKTLKIDSYLQFTKALIDGDVDKFKQVLSAYLIQSGSYFDFTEKTSEQIFHTFMVTTHPFISISPDNAI